MHYLLLPAIALMNRLRFRMKFALILVVVMVPVAGLSYLILSDIQRTNRQVAMERAGIELVGPLRGLLQTIAQHRGMTHAFLKGDTSFRGRILEQRSLIDRHFIQLLANAERHESTLNVGEAMRALKVRWGKLQERAFELSPDAAFSQHTELLAQVMEGISLVGERSRLVLDPFLVTHNLVNALTENLPILAENMGQLRGIGSGLLAQGEVTPTARLRLSLLREKTRSAHRALTSGMARIFTDAPELKASLKARSDQAVASAESFLQLTERELLAGENMTFDAASYFQAGTEAIGATLALFDEAVPILDARLASRATSGSRTERMAYVAVGFIALTVIYLFAGLYLALEETLGRLRSSARRLADGDLTVRLDLKTRDETAQIGTAFNSIAISLSAAVASVRAANDHLTEVAERMLESSQQTAYGVEKQMREVEQAATAITEMSAAIQEVARNTAQAADAAEGAEAAAGKGSTVVNEAIQAIRQLAGEVRRSVDVISRLERESQEISSVLDVIQGIADQTNLLALNAAIEAARAGEQGRGFAVVADEVRTLAQQTHTSTLEIQRTIESLQAGTAEAVGVMKGGAEQAEASVAKATSVGDIFEEITAAVATINGMNAQVATATQEQGSVSEEINRNVGNLSQLSEQTAQDAQQSTAASAKVASLASEMNLLLNKFEVDETAIEAERLQRSKDVLFTWDESFRVGVEEVDRQHQRLVDLVNELHREMSKRRGLAVLERVLNSLVDYTEKHFAYEERLMRESAYPGFSQHKAGHDELTRRVREMQSRFLSGDNTLLAELLNFLSEWLIQHIKGSDRAFGPHLNRHGFH